MALTGPNVNISSTAQTVTGGDSGAVVIGSLTAPQLTLTNQGTDNALVLQYSSYVETDATSAAGRGTKLRLRPSTTNPTNATAVQVYASHDNANSGFGYFQIDEFNNVGIGSGKGGTGVQPAVTYMGAGSVNGISCYTTGSVVVGNYAPIATNATAGFLYIPTCAGVPTGTPTAFTGAAPLVIDSTNNKMYFYSGGAWIALN
jgi:hypothetical protein